MENAGIWFIQYLQAVLVHFLSADPSKMDRKMIISSLSNYKNMQNGICIEFLPFSKIFVVFSLYLSTYCWHSLHILTHFKVFFLVQNQELVLFKALKLQFVLLVLICNGLKTISLLNHPKYHSTLSCPARKV